jgi:hypothetical protein
MLKLNLFMLLVIEVRLSYARGVHRGKQKAAAINYQTAKRCKSREAKEFRLTRVDEPQGYFPSLLY